MTPPPSAKEILLFISSIYESHDSRRVKIHQLLLCSNFCHPPSAKQPPRTPQSTDRPCPLINNNGNKNEATPLTATAFPTFSSLAGWPSMIHVCCPPVKSHFVYCPTLTTTNTTKFADDDEGARRAPNESSDRPTRWTDARLRRFALDSLTLPGRRLRTPFEVVPGSQSSGR